MAKDNKMFRQVSREIEKSRDACPNFYLFLTKLYFWVKRELKKTWEKHKLKKYREKIKLLIKVTIMTVIDKGTSSG
jgi:hypothetical protein